MEMKEKRGKGKVHRRKKRGNERGGSAKGKHNAKKKKRSGSEMGRNENWEKGRDENGSEKK